MLMPAVVSFPVPAHTYRYREAGALDARSCATPHAARKNASREQEEVARRGYRIVAPRKVRDVRIEQMPRLAKRMLGVRWIVAHRPEALDRTW